MPGGGSPADPGARRRRGASATRGAILESATRHFATMGYENAGVRGIAADAGVTAALVNRYFGSKEGLFAAVLERSFDIEAILEGDRATLAERLARHIIFGEEGKPEGEPIPLLLLVRSATSPRAAELLAANLDQNIVAPLARRLGGPDAEARAGLVVAQLTGFALLGKLIRSSAFARAGRERLAALLTASLGMAID